METVILACNTIRDELEKAVAKTNCALDIIWVESGLHLVPDSLRKRMQEELHAIRGPKRVLFAFGFCGNAVLGLKTGDYELIVPKVDDCIPLLLGSRENRKKCDKLGGIYFLTKGWLEGEANIYKEYQAVLTRHGPERTRRIYKTMLAHYKYLGVIDTGAYDLQEFLPRAKEIAATLGLELLVLQGDNGYLERLLSGPWDDDNFITIEPFTTIELFHLGFAWATPDSFDRAAIQQSCVQNGTQR